MKLLFFLTLSLLMTNSFAQEDNKKEDTQLIKTFSVKEKYPELYREMRSERRAKRLKENRGFLAKLVDKIPGRSYSCYVGIHDFGNTNLKKDNGWVFAATLPKAEKKAASQCTMFYEKDYSLTKARDICWDLIEAGEIQCGREIVSKLFYFEF